MQFSDETLKDYFNCKLKAYYKSKKLKFSNNSFYYFEKYLKRQANKNFKKIKNTIYLLDDKSSHIYSIKYNDINKQVLIYDYIEITKDDFAIPIFISGSIKTYQEEKEFYAYKSKQLEVLLNKQVNHYKIVFYDGKIKKIKLQKNSEYTNFNITDKDLKVQKKSHCSICEYKSTCYDNLKKVDDLRLLSSISESQIKKLNNIGYFTIKQYSYSYRPRRSSLITSSKSRYKFELKSLAIRNNKTYVAENIILNHKDIEIFIDFETLPSENYVYLIGVVVTEKNEIIRKVIILGE